MKRILLLGLMVLLVCLTFGCSKKQTTTTAPVSSTNETSTTQELKLTLDELKKYNGKDGQPAYVAVDGIIYDVSSLAKWENGSHQGIHEAGTDLSDVIDQAPHGRDMLNRATVVGKLVK